MGAFLRLFRIKDLKKLYLASQRLQFGYRDWFFFTKYSLCRYIEAKRVLGKDKKVSGEFLFSLKECVDEGTWGKNTDHGGSVSGGG